MKLGNDVDWIPRGNNTAGRHMKNLGEIIPREDSCWLASVCWWKCQREHGSRAEPAPVSVPQEERIKQVA